MYTKKRTQPYLPYYRKVPTYTLPTTVLRQVKVQEICHTLPYTIHIMNQVKSKIPERGLLLYLLHYGPGPSQSITSGIGQKLTPGQFMAGPVKVMSLYYLPHHSPGPIKVYQREVL